MLQNNLTLTMQHFGKLTASERELFLSVIINEDVKPKEKPTKSKEKHKYDEEYFYQLLKKKHNEEVRQRLKKRKKRKNTTAISKHLL
ncbi:hypothetical protein NH341_02380 [Tenacibaculum sp. XPcli2-G]|uniref:hypothetical protein n=1 Tax=Tenacibaculum sp. XPcli2-G TaxID=2954503 RepID=UPI002097461F|nr:hypothetical protein [Tenacibaculum sp. XPcli2-G]MCO7184258.1 hypothetical protein [Tenacibaculum sp. XPcli2-G]